MAAYIQTFRETRAWVRGNCSAIAFVDADDDGWKDLVIANGHAYPEVENAKLGDTYLQPTVLFRNLGNGKFADVTSTSGPFRRNAPQRVGCGRSRRGWPAGDRRVEHECHAKRAEKHRFRRSWVESETYRRAIKPQRHRPRVTAVAGGRKMIDEVMSGGSYYSHNSFTLHFGLGTVDASRPHRGKVAQRPYRGMASCGRRPDRQDCRGRQRARKRNPVELLSPDVFSRSRTHENVLPGQQ
jgi:hypothetical protein